MITDQLKEKVAFAIKSSTLLGIYTTAPLIKGVMDGKGISHEYQTIDNIVKTISTVLATGTILSPALCFGIAPALMKDNNKNVTEESLKAAAVGMGVGLVTVASLFGAAYGLGYTIGKYL